MCCIWLVISLSYLKTFTFSLHLSRSSNLRCKSKVLANGFFNFFMIVTTTTGGHIGFMEGFFPFRKTWIDRLLVQFVSMVFEHDVL